MTVDVPLAEGRDYTITITPSGLSELGQLCATVARSTRAVVITQPGIARRYGATVHNSLQDAGFEVSTVLYPAGERHKHLSTIARLYTELYNLERIDRKTLVIALGGGVVGDMAGYVAATYLRGMDYVQVPTTLLAMVDSSVGGKTGVDFRAGKNLIGAFHQPRAVLIDPHVLATLPRREVRAGLAEVVKYGMIREPELLSFIDTHAAALVAGEASATEHIVARSCAIKAEVVSADEREETGLRAILNFGHTIGHALEGATEYRRYKHGEAIAIGMIAATCIGEAAGVTPATVRPALRATLSRVGLPTQLPDDISDDLLITLAARDKKASGGAVRYVLAADLGEIVQQKVEIAVVRAGLAIQREEERA